MEERPLRPRRRFRWDHRRRRPVPKDVVPSHHGKRTIAGRGPVVARRRRIGPASDHPRRRASRHTMHLHFGRPASPDPETAPQSEPEPVVGLVPQVDVALALAFTPDGEPGEAVQPIDEGAAPDEPVNDVARPAGAAASFVTVDAADGAPTSEAADGTPTDGAPGDGANDDTPAGEAAADAWPD